MARNDDVRVKLKRYPLHRMLDTDPPPVPWVVNPMLARGEVTLLYGARGTGKSLLALALGHGVTQGGEVAGMTCRECRVAYVDAENSKWEIHRRSHTLPLDPDRLAIYDGTGVSLYDDFDAIEATAREHRASLVILDSLRRLTPGVEENDSGAMAEAFARCAQLAVRRKAAVLVIHHAKKDRTTYRGSSAIEDQVSILYRFARTEGHIDPLHRCLTNEKMRIWQEQGERYLRLGIEKGRFVGDLAFAPTEGELVKGHGQAELIPQILAVLDAGPATRLEVAEAVGRTKRDSSVERALKALAKAGRIEKGGDRKWRSVT